MPVIKLEEDPDSDCICHSTGMCVEAIFTIYGEDGEPLFVIRDAGERTDGDIRKLVSQLKSLLP